MGEEQIVIDAIEAAMHNAAAQLMRGKEKPHASVEFSIDYKGEAIRVKMDITASHDEPAPKPDDSL